MSSYYRKVTTYRHDFNQGQAPGYDRSDDLMKRIDYSKPPKFSDPAWQRGRNESSEQYDQRLQEMSNNMKPDYYRTYEERRPEDYHGGQADRHGYTDYNKARERYHFEQDVFDRRRRGLDNHDAPHPDDYRNGRSDRFGFTDYDRAKAHYLGYSEGHDQRRREHERRHDHERRHEIGHGYPDGSQTERGRYDHNHDPKKKDIYQYKDYVNNRAMADYVIVEKEYDRYRPTQKDYGSFETAPKIDNMPRPYRGQFDKQPQNTEHQPQQYYREQQQQLPVREERLPPEQRRGEMRENRRDERDDPQARRDINKIEMHEGNFKPYASNYYEDKLRSNNKPSQNESGVYMLIRANASDLDEVKKSFQKHKTILKMSGHLTGIATADQVRVDGDDTNWTQKSAILMVLWFPSAKAAENWMVYDSDFKIASFPYPNGADIVIVPVNYIPPNDDRCTTFVITEYPEVKNPEYFRTGIIEPMQDILRYFKCEPFVVRTTGVLVERGCWISPKSSVTIHRFADAREAERFHKDSRVSLLKGKLNGLTKGGRYTTVRFTLNFLV